MNPFKTEHPARTLYWANVKRVCEIFRVVRGDNWRGPATDWGWGWLPATVTQTTYCPLECGC
jgi:hypothetical protein